MNCKLASLLLFAVFSMIGCSMSIPFRKLLSTDKYFIVGVNDCTVTTETDIADGLCPSHMTDFDAKCTHKGKIFSLLYLPREKESQEPAQILNVFEERSFAVFQLQPIKYENRNFSTYHHALKTESFVYLMRKNVNLHFERIFAVVYNHRAQLLYVLSYGSWDHNDAVVDVFMMYPDIYKKMTYKHVANSSIDEYFLRTEWSADPHLDLFYYHKKDKLGDKPFSNIYSVPAESLLIHLFSGIPGKMEKSLANDPVAMYRDGAQVTNGLIYSFVNPTDRSSSVAFRSVRTFHGGSASRCASRTIRTSDYMFILTGWEYCKLLNGKSAVYEECIAKSVAEQQEQANAEDVSTFANFGILLGITIAVIANAVLLLVILCLVCKRSKNDAMIISETAPFVHSRPKTRHHILKTPDAVFEKRRLNSTATSIY